MSRRSRFPPRIGENLQRWERQLSALVRSTARDLIRNAGAGATEEIKSPQTDLTRDHLCRSLARAFDGLPAGYSFLGVLDDLAERLRLDGWQLLSFIAEGERSLGRDEIPAGSRRPGPRLREDGPQKGSEGA